MKSERLQHLERELEVHESCISHGLFPKREKERYLEDIRLIKAKIEAEKENIRMRKESGEGEEYVIPKRNPARQPYADPNTMPDMDTGEFSDGADMETDHFDSMSDTQTHSDDETESGASEEDTDAEVQEDEDGFSSKAARIKRFGQARDPDKDWSDLNDS